MSATPASAASIPSLPVRVLTACRPWGTPISVVPVLMGAAMAVVYGGAPLHWGRLGLTMLAVWMVHSASNMLSDVADFRKVATSVSGPNVQLQETGQQIVCSPANW